MVRDTVFSPSFGNRPSQLVGREGVVRAFLDGLSQPPGNRDRATLVIGQRGSGKTVLLWELADRARDKGFVVANPTIATSDMLDRIIEKIQDDGSRFAQDSTARLAGGSLGALGFSFGLQFSRDVRETKSFAYKLAHLCRKLAESDRGVLILVDEVQANSAETRHLVAAYQELVGERADIALVMAGLPSAISETLNDRVLTFLNRARRVELSPLATSDVDAFFARSFDQLGIDVSEQQRQRAVEATYGSPYMLQLVGHAVVAHADDDGTLSDGALERALASSKPPAADPWASPCRIFPDTSPNRRATPYKLPESEQRGNPVPGNREGRENDGA